MNQSNIARKISLTSKDVGCRHFSYSVRNLRTFFPLKIKKKNKKIKNKNKKQKTKNKKNKKKKLSGYTFTTSCGTLTTFL